MLITSEEKELETLQLRYQLKQFYLSCVIIPYDQALIHRGPSV